MKIKIKYTAQLKKAVGKREETIELEEGIKLAELLYALYKDKKQAFSNIVFNNEGEFMNAVLIILNGEQVGYDYAEPLIDNDVITIMSPIAGG